MTSAAPTQAAPRSHRRGSSSIGSAGGRIKLGRGAGSMTSVGTKDAGPGHAPSVRASPASEISSVRPLHGDRRADPLARGARSEGPGRRGGFVMQSRRNGEFKRSVLSALAAMVAAVVPSLVSSPALADKPEPSTADAKASTDPPAKQAPKKDAKKTPGARPRAPATPGEAGHASTKKDAPKKKRRAPEGAGGDAGEEGRRRRPTRRQPKGKKTKKTGLARAASLAPRAAKKADKEGATALRRHVDHDRSRRARGADAAHARLPRAADRGVA